MNQKIVLAIIAIVPACLTAILGYFQGTKSTDSHAVKAELASKQISLSYTPNPNLRHLTYPNYGMSLQVPLSWTIEDGPARLAGGEFNLVHRYEDTRGAIGISFRLRPVQPNYVGNLEAQVENQRITFEKNYPGAKVVDAAISGFAGKLFTYEAPTGKRKMLVKQYWIRVVPDVQLQILCAQYTDAVDAEEFWRQTDQVLSSIVIAFDTWQARYKKDKNL